MTSGMSTGSSARRTVTAFFDSRSDAENAVERLIATGIPRDSVRLTPGNERDREDTGDASVRPESGGFWDSLTDLFLPDEDRSTYAEGLRRGGYLISVNAGDEQYDRVIDILDDEGTIDIDERAESWRAEGWSGSAASDAVSSPTGGSMAGAAGAMLGASSSTRGSASVPSAGAVDYGTTNRGASGDEEVIPIVEEHLRVGKRDVSHGRVRIRSYVVETPVEEQVTLRDERVAVERRPVDRALGDAEGAFQERTIEAEERTEEAVISKEARVKEELVVRKDVDQRTQTVSDTVRQTEVEVEDERGTRSSETAPVKKA